MSKRSALIVGGSLAGLMAARLLARDGWHVVLCERVTADLSSRGAGIVTHPELFACLADAGARSDHGIGVSVSVRRLLDPDGRIAYEAPFPQVVASWATIYSILGDGIGPITYRPGCEFKHYVQDGNKVTACFTDGSTVVVDLLVGADGFRSTVRRQLLPDIVPLFAGYITWRGVVPLEAVSDETRRIVCEEFCFYLPDGEQIAGYPIGEQAGDGGTERRAFNYVWYRSVDDAGLARLLTDAAGNLHELNIPPPLVDPAHVAAMRSEAATLLAPQFAELVLATPNPFFQPIYDLEVPRMFDGRVVLIGDSAFVARPHVGAGVSKALGDASELARALREIQDPGLALAAYDAARRPVGSRIVAQARYLGDCMQAYRRTPGDIGQPAARQSPESIVHETATLGFLR